MERINSESRTTKVKAVKNIVKDLNFRSALIKVSKLYEEKVEHPKLVELQKIIEKEFDKNIYSPNKNILESKDINNLFNEAKHNFNVKLKNIKNG